MTSKFVNFAGCGVTLAVLVACGGSETAMNGIGISDAEAQLQLFAADAGTVGAALETGETLSARAVGTSALQRDYEGQSSSVLEDVLVQVKKNDAGELTLIIDGTEVPFATSDRRVEDDGRVFGYQQNGDNFYYSLFSWDGELDDVLATDNGNARVVNFYFEEPDSSTGALGFAIIGTETGADDLPTTDSATFTGFSVTEIFPQDGLTRYDDTRERLRGDVEMTANFGAGTISGEMTNLNFQDPPNDGNGIFDVPGTIMMEEATFNANGFTGDLVADNTATNEFRLTDSNIGTYGGTFYGEDASEVAGAITINSENDNGIFNGFGYFKAD